MVPLYNFRLKVGIHGPKLVGPGPSGSVLVLGPDEDQQNLEMQDRDKKLKSRTGNPESSKFLNFEPNRTRTEKNFRTWD